jgi:hypothetical protein
MWNARHRGNAIRKNTVQIIAKSMSAGLFSRFIGRLLPSYVERESGKSTAKTQ